jgi:hypothetical protein
MNNLKPLALRFPHARELTTELVDSVNDSLSKDLFKCLKGRFDRLEVTNSIELQFMIQLLFEFD